MSTPLTLIETTAVAPIASGLGDSWVDRLHELVAPVLVDDRIIVHSDDPIGGEVACQITGCPRSAPRDGLCSVHLDRWVRAGRPTLKSWDPGDLPGPQWLSLAALPTPLRWEIAYGIVQARQTTDMVRQGFAWTLTMVRDLAELGIASLLEHPEHAWPLTRLTRNREQPSIRLRCGFLTFVIDELDKLRGTYGREHEFVCDLWRLRRLGLTGRYAGLVLDFGGIEQLWLREVIKKFLRWRVDIGHSASGMHRDVRTLTQLAHALTDCAGPDARPQQFTRNVITRYLTLLAEDGLTPNGRRQRISSASRFLLIARQHNWIPLVPAGTAFYPEDAPAETQLIPRALPAIVMTQLENPANLDKLTDRRWRLLFPLLIQTGLRINDALHLPQDCVVYDQQQAPYLRYRNRKMKREALVPISVEMAIMITEQARWARHEYSPRAVLFPRLTRNRHGLHAAAASVAHTALKTWITECPILDESGSPARVSPHQFRHTLGTRLINNDVPQEVVRKILDHTSTEMTAHYARLHDSTVRRHWERARKIDINGNEVTITADSPLADAQWAKQHLSRATQALPNGYCGLPLQQSCPHANACLTCPVFITTAEFLPQHREQLELTRGIIERAQQRGQLRLVEMNQRTADNLTNIIGSLENNSATDKLSDNDAC
jgi:site-specific recombinase XerD